jgi:hypothetical protein
MAQNKLLFSFQKHEDFAAFSTFLLYYHWNYLFRNSYIVQSAVVNKLKGGQNCKKLTNFLVKFFQVENSISLHLLAFVFEQS